MLFSLALFLAACSAAEEPVVYASFAPASPIYELLEVQVTGAGQAGEGGIALTFRSNGGMVISFTLTARGGELYLAQDLPGIGVGEGDLVSAEVLRAILVESGVVSGGQFKVTEAERTRKLVLALTDPAQLDKVDMQGFQLVETNITADE